MAVFWRACAVGSAGLLVWVVATGCSSGDGTPGSSKPATASSTSATGDDASGEGTSSGRPATAATDPDDAAGASRGTGQVAVLKTLPGLPGHACASVVGKRDVRAGDFGAGPFDEATRSFRKQSRAGQPATVRLYFIPATGGDQLPGLALTVRNVRTGDQHTVKDTDTADADGWSFYDVQVPIPAAGTYELRAVSGRDAGCFRVRFR